MNKVSINCSLILLQPTFAKLKLSCPKFINLFTYYIYRITTVYFNTKHTWWTGLSFNKKKHFSLYKVISSNINGARIQKFQSSLIFLYLGFLYRHWSFIGQQGKGVGHNIQKHSKCPKIHTYMKEINGTISHNNHILVMKNTWKTVILDKNV